MSWLPEKINRLVDTLEQRGHVKVARGIDLVVAVVQQLVGREALQHSAALSFTTILSLIPLFAVVFAVLNAFVSSKAVVSQVSEWMLDTLFADSVSDIVAHLSTFLEDSQAAVGLVGLSFFFVASFSLFLSVENSLNRIWLVPNTRPFYRRLMTFYVVITLAPTLIALGSLSAGWILDALSMPYVGAYLGAVVSWLLFLLALFLMYALMPHTPVKLKPALLGALWASIIFQLSRAGFNLYVLMVYTGSERTKIYGGFALIPVFFLWIYLTWVIILSGVKVTYLIQNRERLTRVFDRQRTDGVDGSGPPTGYLLVRAYYAVALHFTVEGGGLNPAVISDSLGLAPHQTKRALDRLVNEGYVLSVHGDGGKEIVPARPVEKVSIHEIHSLGRLSGIHSGYLSVPDDPLEGILKASDGLRDEALGAQTFADLIEATLAPPREQLEVPTPSD